MEELLLNQFTSIICPQSNQAQMICVSQKCQSNAFLCFAKNCDCHLKIHKNCQCYHLHSLVSSIIEKKKKVPLQLQKAFEAIDKIYQQLLDKLSLDRQEVRKKMQSYGLTLQQSQFLQLINQRQFDKITGSLTHNLKNKIQIKQDYQGATQKGITIYWESQKNDFYNLSQQLKMLIYQKGYFDILPSVISQDHKTLRSFFDKPILNFQLLYRASQNNFLVSKFHQKCDNIPDTVTIIKTEYGKIIGGYTPLIWYSPEKQERLADNSKQSFLFSLSLKQKFPIIQNDYAIYCNTVSGPNFGKGADLCISDGANKNKKSYSYFPWSYCNGKYQRQQNTYKLFCGAQQGFKFTIEEWEVFKVNWLVTKT